MVFVGNRKLHYGTKIFVYFNLHKKCFSIKALEGEFKNKVVAHAERLAIKEAILIVNQKGRARVLREKRKNVHAGIVGYFSPILHKKIIKEVTYNPYDYDSFVYLESKTPVFHSPYVFLENKKVYL